MTSAPPDTTSVIKIGDNTNPSKYPQDCIKTAVNQQKCAFTVSYQGNDTIGCTYD